MAAYYSLRMVVTAFRIPFFYHPDVWALFYFSFVLCNAIMKNFVYKEFFHLSDDFFRMTSPT